MSYTKENVESETDVSMMVKASSGGGDYVMMLSHRNLLELEDWIPHGTPTPYGDLESFQKEFGEYVIVG